MLVLKNNQKWIGKDNVYIHLISNLNETLRRYCTPNQKLACFVLYRKIINKFMKNNTSIL